MSAPRVDIKATKIRNQRATTQINALKEKVFIPTKDPQTEYETVNQIGEGAFAYVFKVIRLKDNKTFALKRIKSKPKLDHQQLEILRECYALNKMNHKHCMTAIDIFQFDGITMMIMEYMNYNVGVFITNKLFFSVDELLNILKQIFCGLKHFHALSLIHRDMKEVNVLFNNDGVAKIADFGLARIDDKEYLKKSQVGTPGYTAPEILITQTYGKSVDTWSTLVMMIRLSGLLPECFTELKKAPFTSQKLVTAYENIAKKAIKKFKDTKLEAIVVRGMVMDGKSRITATEIYDKLLACINEKENNKLYEYAKGIDQSDESKEQSTFNNSKNSEVAENIDTKSFGLNTNVRSSTYFGDYDTSSEDESSGDPYPQDKFINDFCKKYSLKPVIKKNKNKPKAWKNNDADKYRVSSNLVDNLMETNGVEEMKTKIKDMALKKGQLEEIAYVLGHTGQFMNNDYIDKIVKKMLELKRFH